jgi:hypothetical protein
MSAPRPARGNGAFPDSLTVLIPADRPAPIVLATNFGLLVSYDQGQTWLWSCEQEANAFGSLYQYGGPPRDRMFAVAGQQVVFSDDDSCTWQVAGGRAAGQPITDAFAVPGDPDRVLAAAYDGGARAYTMLESRDGGATFSAML